MPGKDLAKCFCEFRKSLISIMIKRLVNHYISIVYFLDVSNILTYQEESLAYAEGVKN